jgi:uncharacterized protein (UPF0218 family)
MLHNLTNKQGRHNTNHQSKLASGNKVNVVNTVTKNPKTGGSVMPLKAGGTRNIAKKDHSIIIVGDSHSKGFATNVKSYLLHNYKVQGLMKPGTCSDILTKAATNVIKNLNKNDFLILWSDANDVAKNNIMKVFRYLVDFAKNGSHTNVILASVPHRHDLMSSSCVNEEGRVFNRKLMKISNIFGHVSFMEVHTNREYYTKYGHHLNNFVKAKVSKQLSLQLLSVLQRKKDILIRLRWTKDHANNMHDGTQNQVKNPPSTITTE